MPALLSSSAIAVAMSDVAACFDAALTSTRMAVLLGDWSVGAEPRAARPCSSRPWSFRTQVDRADPPSDDMPNVTSVVLRSQPDGRRSDQLASVTMILPARKWLPLPA